MEIRKLAAAELRVLTELFEYNDPEQMLHACAEDIQSKAIDIFVLYDNNIPIGSFEQDMKVTMRILH